MKALIQLLILALVTLSTTLLIKVAGATTYQSQIDFKIYLTEDFDNSIIMSRESFYKNPQRAFVRFSDDGSFCQLILLKDLYLGKTQRLFDCELSMYSTQDAEEDIPPYIQFDSQTSAKILYEVTKEKHQLLMGYILEDVKLNPLRLYLDQYHQGPINRIEYEIKTHTFLTIFAEVSFPGPKLKLPFRDELFVPGNSVYQTESTKTLSGNQQELY